MENLWFPIDFPLNHSIDCVQIGEFSPPMWPPCGDQGVLNTMKSQKQGATRDLWKEPNSPPISTATGTQRDNKDL